jgi:hypothetical protein
MDFLRGGRITLQLLLRVVIVVKVVPIVVVVIFTQPR